MLHWKEGWLRARTALLIVVFAIFGCGAFFLGLELAGLDDCRAFPGAAWKGLCGRFGSIVAAAPLILIGAALIALLFIGPRWLKEPPTPQLRMTRRSRLVAKVFFTLLGLGIIVDGVLLATGVQPCSDLKVDSVQYRAVGDGLAKICETLGPAIPASFAVLFGALILLGIYKGMFDGE
ncbi:MAG TPA: hypothetical protein VN851_21420 [Thermoanaerobaculia bacterium]|nr:hypothetical protein [Thermoanaerobaculia bacterium]